MDRSRHDVNLVPTLAAVSNLDGETPVSLWADPQTHELIATIAQDTNETLGLLLDRLEYGLITDNAKVLQVGIKNGTITTVTTVTTVSTVTTVASVTAVQNTVRQGDLQMQRVNEAIMDAAFINGITNNIAVT